MNKANQMKVLRRVCVHVKVSQRSSGCKSRPRESLQLSAWPRGSWSPVSCLWTIGLLVCKSAVFSLWTTMVVNIPGTIAMVIVYQLVLSWLIDNVDFFIRHTTPQKWTTRRRRRRVALLFRRVWKLVFQVEVLPSSLSACSFSASPTATAPPSAWWCCWCVQRALVRTISMLCAFTSILLFSHVASWLFHSGLLPQRWDMFGVKASHSPAPPVVVHGGWGPCDERDKLSESDCAARTSDETKCRSSQTFRFFKCLSGVFLFPTLVPNIPREPKLTLNWRCTAWESESD